MEGMIIANQSMTATAEINADLFGRFVSFIDRSERTTKTHLTNLKQFMAWLRYRMITRPQREDIISYRDWLGTTHTAISYDPTTRAGYSIRYDCNGKPERISCKPATVKAYLQSVKQFFTWTAAENIYPNIAQNIHAPKVGRAHKKDSFTPEQVLNIENSIAARAELNAQDAAAAIKDAAGRIQRADEQGKRLYAMYLLAVNAGLRTVELSRANIKDLQTADGHTWLYVWGKGRTSPDQKKPIAPEVKAAIDDYLSSRSDSMTSASPLFVSTGNRSKGQRIAPTTISTMLKKAMIDAGYSSERYTAHSLRHTAGQNVLDMTGKNIYKAQMYLRHASPATTEIYLDNDAAAADEAIARDLYARYHGQKKDEGAKLGAILSTMTPEQLAALATIAATMQH